jgi:hypothetical protein
LLLNPSNKPKILPSVAQALTDTQKHPERLPLFKQGVESKLDHPLFYHYGYRFIHPQDKEMEWEYAIQLHKNQNGKHWDLRLARPGEDKAYSWAMKKIPLVHVKPVLAIRTFDHNLEHLNFEGPLTTARGYGDVKLIQRGKTKVKKIDENGIQLEINGKDYRLRPFAGKKYLFEQVIF